MSEKKGKGPVFDPGLCRCCGNMKRCRLLNLEYDSLGQKEIYSDMIMDCFGLLVCYLDGKPTERLICATCVKRLREAIGFKKQVLKCEEAFLQMKVYDKKNEDCEQRIEQMPVDSRQRVEIDLVKIEPLDSDPGTLDNDALADDAPDRDYEEPKPDPANEDDMPLKALLVRRAASAGRAAPPARRPQPAPGFRHLLLQKPNIPMSKVQQMIREKDPSYMAETNILTIIEHSYVCPFKCRHNHLLCYYCGQDFADPGLLRDHTDAAHHPKRFKITDYKNMVKIDVNRVDCRLCATKVDTLEEFKRHITTVHNKKYYFNSRDPVLPFKLTKEDMKCAICDAMFPYFHALNKHMNEHYSNYVCETCGLGFVDKGRFVMHQQRHDVGEFPCQTCGKVFKAQYNRDLHVDRVHKKRGRVYCPKCDVTLMSYHQKLKHLVEVHGEQPLSFPCNMCERVFETRRTFTIHRRKEHLKDYRYECQCCGQRFFTRFALNNHMPTHTGERNFKCKVCEKSYPRLKTLKDHMRIHTNDRRYRCHICGQAFIQNCSLKGHMKSQHPEYG